MVQINEVLAKNSETQGFGGVFPDIIELRNAGTAAADISGWGLTDNALLPYKYSIPAGTTLAPGAYLVIYADANVLVPQPQTGFGLKQGGDTLTLTQSPAAGGAVADSIPFGAQVADYSIGRRPSDGQWDLCVPTFGSANVVAAQGAIANLKINEWLADAVALAPNDFIELYNSDTKPVALGNAYLTDNPVEWPTRHQIRQLTFVGAGGYVAFKADNDPEQGADHLDFKLSPAQGEIGLFSPSQVLIDNIVYGSQSSDVSEGRTPNGSATIAFFNQPTPGAPNPGEVGGGGTTTTTTLIAPTQVWKYYANATAAPANDAQGRSFISPTYNDASWVSGGGVLYIENATIPPNSDGFAKTTLLPPATPASPNTPPYQTYYFRTHFNFSGSLAGVTLAANVMSDDGAVFYLNGQELVPTGGRLRMPAGAVTYATLTTNMGPDDTIETLSFPAAQLIAGDNVLAVEVHQGVLQSGGNPSSDITWGMKLTSTVTTVAGTSAVVLNEVLPINVSFQNPDGSFAGWIELSNTSATAVDISDMSLTDDVTIPRKFVFPQGTSIPGNGFVVFYCNPLAAPSASNTGFGLSGNGGGVFMFGKIANGGGLHDSVVYGQQVPDFSIGRIPNGTGPFALSVPTYGALNQAAGLGPITAVKINEWLALPNVPPAFFELYNTSAQPVLLSGNYLTDNLNNKTKYLLPPLSFIGGAGSSHWLSFIADNDASATPGHVNFSIDPAGESLGLFAANGVRLESVTFGPQAIGISQGRFPDGTATIVTLTPTPSAPNQQSATDTDGDGMPDDWEIAHGFNPNDGTDALGDADGDGQSNYLEYLEGTDPRDAMSRFTVTITSPVPGQIHILFTAQANKGYTVQFKTTPGDPVWQRLSDVAAQSLLHQVDILDNVGTTAQRFYRVVTPQQP